MSNGKIISDYLRAVFVERDLAKAETFFGPTKTEHNPGMPNGHDAVRGFITNAPKDLVYEQGLIAETGDYVMVHGRYSGWEGKTMVAVDIFRLEDGKVVEHWDVMQEEVPAEKSVSGNAMFPVISMAT